MSIAFPVKTSQYTMIPKLISITLAHCMEPQLCDICKETQEVIELWTDYTLVIKPYTLQSGGVGNRLTLYCINEGVCIVMET